MKNPEESPPRAKPDEPFGADKANMRPRKKPRSPMGFSRSLDAEVKRHVKKVVKDTLRARTAKAPPHGSQIQPEDSNLVRKVFKTGLEVIMEHRIQALFIALLLAFGKKIMAILAVP